MWLTAPFPCAPCVLRLDGAGVVVDEILHEAVGAKERVGKAGSLYFLFRIAVEAGEYGLATTQGGELHDVLHA